MLDAFWRALPTNVRHGLLMGSVGSEHLERLADQARQAQRSDLACGFYRALWEQFPLDGAFAEKTLQAARAAACDDAPLELMRRVSAHWRLPIRADVLHQLVDEARYDEAYDFACAAAEREERNLYWAEQVQVLGLMQGAVGDAAQRIARLPLLGNGAFSPLRDYFQGNAHFAAQRWSQAAEFFARAAAHPEAGGWLAPVERGAEALWRLERRDAALELWRRVLLRKPWHSSLLLHVHSLLEPPEIPSDFPPTAALVYSWNKAGYLDETLGELARTQGLAAIHVLDNGSTDDTPSVVRVWQERLGRDNLRAHTLPVNIGAPAARNWLAALPELERMECVAYLDDDALPPADWLESLHAARLAYPESTAWGCRVVDHDSPEITQSADIHLLLDTDAAGDPTLVFDLERAYAETFRVTELFVQTPRWELFQYVRPCLSVTGCCHLLDMRELKEGGGFDLRFSPTQYDDLERDMRRALAGRFCCYHGGVTVRHKQRSGRRVKRHATSQGNWLGNRYKLMHRFQERELRALHERQHAVLMDDLEARFPVLERVLRLLTQGRGSG